MVMLWIMYAQQVTILGSGTWNTYTYTILGYGWPNSHRYTSNIEPHSSIYATPYMSTSDNNPPNNIGSCIETRCEKTSAREFFKE